MKREGRQRYYPRRRRAGWFPIIRAEGAHASSDSNRIVMVWGLPYLGAFDLVAEIAEIVRTDA